VKLFAPRNNWDMKSPDGWFPLMGSVQTSSGVTLTEDSALGLTAFSCGLRVISETISSLPCHFLERKDERTTNKATGHALYDIVHDQPNPEQDTMLFFDSQISLQVGWGDAYSEVERFAGEVKAIWPIHPSRIPLSNIRRNGKDPKATHAGAPGELVYYVNNDDGTATPIPASSMLHVAGALSRNGITGRGLIKLGKNALGIAQATEEHAGAFFRNGANPNLAIKSPKIVGKETADRLRQQWQTVFGGVRNHYKTILLEDGMEAVPFTLSPQMSQMIEQRQYGVTEVARLLRMPPYFLMDLTSGKYNNVEAQGQDLVIYSLMPWIVRWERAMQRQLLTPEEKKRYKFKFNVMGLLRGDQAARAAFYQAGFNMGVLSPNDIREYEDLNPVEGGDQRFVPRNNLVPLTSIGELAQAELDKTKAETKKIEEPTPAPVVAAPPAQDNTAAEAMIDEARQIKAQMLVALEQLRDSDGKQPDLTPIFERFDALPTQFAEELQPLADGFRVAVQAMADEQRAEREQLPAMLTRTVTPLADAVGTLAEATGNLPSAVGKAVSEATTPLVEAQKEAFAEFPAQFQALGEKIDGIEFPAPPEPAPVDTSAAEAVAAREALADQRDREMSARLSAEREASRNVLAVALQVRIENLVTWESKSLTKELEQPKGFKAWREKFYPRFVKQFAAELAELEPFATQIGVSLDLEASADSYALASINDLKTLDDFAADNWHDRLKEGVDTLRKNLWTGRAQNLAREMVEQGKQRFAEKTHA
jgi:HK97 family phage portal protein